MNWTFGYDAVGNRNVVRDNDGRWTTYTYDPKNRLTQDVTIGLNTHTYGYSYDGNDNRLTSNETGNLTTFTYDNANRLVTSEETGHAVVNYDYDQNGNLIGVVNEVEVVMGYDPENRLDLYIDTVNVVLEVYTYDGDGKKRAEKITGQTTTLVWDGDDYLQART